ncbi:MAG: hypothetical protein KF819_40775 [Labilithrix sp.]|nr:hypothetical protein [Labilithrix sp.]
MNDEEEFLEDFGAVALSDSELEALLERARATDDAELRRLVKQHRAVRYAGEALLSHVESTQGLAVINANPMLKIARFFLRGRP